jgi:hypothetical protein
MVAHRAFEGSKNLMRGTFEVQIKIGRKRGRPALGDRGCDPSRMLIRRQGLRLGSGILSSSSHARCYLATNFSLVTP